MSRGQNLTIQAKGQLLETIDNGTIHLKVKWSIVTLINKDFDLCENADIINEKCPLEKRIFKVAKEVVIPEAPAGTYHVTVAAYTSESDGRREITCVEGKITF